MSDTAVRTAKLRAALTEVLTKRDVFSQETYTQIVMSLYERIRVLQTQPFDQQESDEIRLVTVMFLDIINSTELARRLQAENWKKIISDTHSLLSRIIRKWGGEVGQYLGDGVLCFFGAQHSQEDDALRAVHCALEAQDAITRYAQEINDEYNSLYSGQEGSSGILFAMRIGMSTGQVVVGMVGDAEKQELVAMGATTNLASRLQSMCDPGKVLIDAETYHRVRDHFVTEAHELMQLKGFENPIECYTVVEARPADPSRLASTRIAGLETPFVGREAELHQLLMLCQQAQREGHFYAATIVGDMGVGKSRLLQEFLSHARDFGFTSFIVTGSYEKRTTPYSFLHQLLAQRCHLKDDTPANIAEERILRDVRESWQDDEAEQTAHLLGFLGGFGFSESAHVRAINPGSSEQRRAIFARIARWFRALAQSAPLLFVVDNLHWLDFESLDLLEYLASELANYAGVMIGTARPEFDQEHRRYLAAFAQHQPMTLPRLSEADITHLLEPVLSRVENIPERLLQLIIARAEGNPLFVEAFLQMLFDYGVFEMMGDGRWKADRLLYATLESQLPNSLLGLLQARLDELSPNARRIAQIAAVIGQTFWESAVQAVSDSEQVQSELLYLEKRGIIYQHPDSVFEQERQYSFQHMLYREVAYAMLTRPTRKAYHQAAAVWLEKRVAAHPDYLDALAEHYLKAEQPEQALTTYSASARSLFQRGLLPKSLHIIERGWDVARSVSREFALPIVSQLWLLRGQALDDLDEYEEASAASETALMLMDELPFEEMIAERVRAALTLASSYIHLGQYHEALQTLNRAHSLLPKEHTHLHAAVLRAFGILYRAQGQLNESLAYQQQAFTLARESGDQREIARVMAMLGSIALDRGDFATALAYYDRVLHMNRQTGNFYYQILDLSQIATIYRVLFAYDTALALCQQAETLQAQIHYQDPLVAVNRALCLVAKGETTQGLTLLREASERHSQNVYTRQQIRLALIQGLALAEDYEACIEHASALSAETAERNVIIHARALLSQGYAMHALNAPDAYETLLRAAELEMVYGGRDLWQCYYALSHAAPEAADRRAYREKALQILQATATSLHTRPDLQAIVERNFTRLASSGSSTD